MDKGSKLRQKAYYKIRIITIFSVVTVLLVIALSRAGYVFIKDLYLNQLGEQVNIVTRMISQQIENEYLNLLSLGAPTETTKQYFYKIFNQNLDKKLHSEIFIFNNQYDIEIHSDSNKILGKPESRLILNQKEINDLAINQSTASLPFKGDDGNWYLWGFYRLNENHFLAVRESAARFEKVERFSAIFWYIGIAGTLITILVGWLMARAITNPLYRLVRFSEEIGKGNFKAQEPNNLKGEIKYLAQAMGKMKNDLSENQDQKENMLAQIAHEIRNPLGGIELLTNLAKENLPANEKNDDYFDRILHEVHRLKNLITSFLNYSKPVPANPEWIDLRLFVDEIEKNFCGQLKEQNIELEKDFQFYTFWFDKNHLTQIIINLISNSIASVKQDGIIHFQAKKEGKNWMIKVSDSGKGISKENINSIFTPFFTTKKNGTGLGLAISKKLCKENFADLIAENNSSQMTTFSIIKEAVNEI